MKRRTDIYLRIDKEILAEDLEKFQNTDEFGSGGDTYSPRTFKWQSCVLRITEQQYREKIGAETDLIQAENCRGLNERLAGKPGDPVRLWLAEKNGLYFVAAGTQEAVVRAFERHFKTRFKEVKK